MPPCIYKRMTMCVFACTTIRHMLTLRNEVSTKLTPSAFRRHDQRKKTYVVFRGRRPRIYSSWVECHKQVNGFTGCLFRSYSSLEEAETG
ncbi:Ribosomal protein L9/RNase H1, N-terminal [Sesbania bispinosa]|nr:Ribosomal protein L9/RNase H1, N-terminal [Sesbania bispinosa]